MKCSIEDHIRDLNNLEANLCNARDVLKNLHCNFDKACKRIEFLKAQIQEAKKRGLSSFDDERLLVKRSIPAKKTVKVRVEE